MRQYLGSFSIEAGEVVRVAKSPLGSEYHVTGASVVVVSLRDATRHLSRVVSVFKEQLLTQGTTVTDERGIVLDGEPAVSILAFDDTLHSRTVIAAHGDAAYAIIAFAPTEVALEVGHQAQIFDSFRFEGEHETLPGKLFN